MSAAAPLPPPGPTSARAMNGYMNGAHGNGADGSRGSDGAGDPRGAGGSYPPIAEIVASASETVEALKHRSVCGDTR
jgi:ubiquitin carboxyl-terminal hydrolase 8